MKVLSDITELILEMEAIKESDKRFRPLIRLTRLKRTPIQLDIDGSSGKKYIDDNTYEDDNEIKQIYKRGDTAKVIRFDDNNKYYYLNKSNSNNRLNINNEFNYK